MGFNSGFKGLNRCMLLTDGRETSLQTARVRFLTFLSICYYWKDVEQT